LAEAAAQKRYGERGFNPAQPYYFNASPALLAQEPANLNEVPETKAPDWLGWPQMYLHLEQRLAGDKTWRLPWWRTWGDIARFELPRRYHAFIVENNYNKGLRKDGNILDNTATLDLEACTNGLMVTCTDPDSEWLQLGPGIPGMELDRAGMMFFEDLTETLRFVQDQTNFYESLDLFYEDITAFGTGVTVDYEDKENIFISKNPCAGEFCLAAGADYADQVLEVEERRTVSQIVEQFGLANCPEEVKQKWRQKGGALEYEYVVGHTIEPNFAIEGREPGSECGRLPGGFTWREIYWIVGKSNEAPLSVAGFREKPFAAAPWHRVSNDPYGHGLGETILGDTIQLQIMVAREAELAEKLARPSYSAPVSLKNDPHSTKPDHITYYDSATGAPEFKPNYVVDPQALAALRENMEKVRERIHRGSHADLFRAIEEIAHNTKRDVSATEIDAVREELLRQLGGVIYRVYRYGLQPRIKRQLAILHRRGMWPKLPPSLYGIPLQVSFESELTRARRAGSVSSIERTYAFAQSIAAEFPDSKYVLDADESVREVAKLRGASSRIIRSASQVRLLKQQAQAAAQLAAQAQVGQAAVQGANTLSKTGLGGNTALSALLGNQA
jgi:hypothetical protein